MSAYGQTRLWRAGYGALAETVLRLEFAVVAALSRRLSAASSVHVPRIVAALMGRRLEVADGPVDS